MKQNYIILILLFFASIGNAQVVKLNRESNLDTLKVWMTYSDDIEDELQIRLQESVTKGIDRFNIEQKGFTVLLDSNSSTTSMRIKMGGINYLDGKDNAIWTSVGLNTLAGHAYIISALGYTLPILLLPSTVSKVQSETSEDLVTNLN